MYMYLNSVFHTLHYVAQYPFDHLDRDKSAKIRVQIQINVMVLSEG
jgi:hypothetical protein